MLPHYFGPVEARLFGCYHAPSPDGPRLTGVLLSNPTGHEYMACYRTIRQTAVRLAQSGAPALRFDYYGAGDSAGASDAGRPGQWVADIRAATEELQKCQHALDVVLAGWRLGATLSLLCMQHVEPTEARGLILWDPIVDGAAYVDELTNLQRERFGGSQSAEVLGFPFPETVRTEL